MVIRRIGAILLAGTFMIGSVGVLQARDRDDKCQQRVQKAERNLERDVQKHGEHSRQAEKRRRELDEARAKCGGDHHDHNDHDHH